MEVIDKESIEINIGQDSLLESIYDKNESITINSIVHFLYKIKL